MAAINTVHYLRRHHTLLDVFSPLTEEANTSESCRHDAESCHKLNIGTLTITLNEWDLRSSDVQMVFAQVWRDIWRPLGTAASFIISGWGCKIINYNKSSAHLFSNSDITASTHQSIISSQSYLAVSGRSTTVQSHFIDSFWSNWSYWS